MKKGIKHLLRSIKLKLSHNLGLVSYKQRMAPSFIIVGAQKGGTSSLYYYLKFHPQVKRPIKKEIHYFNIYFERGLKWYLAHFPIKSNKYITGEASPGYIFHPDAPQRIKDLNPNIKLIFLLRDPIERAYSAFQMNKRMGVDTRATFDEAIDYELKHSSSNSDYNYDRHNYYYLERGQYASQLSKWTEHFSDDQMLLIKSSDFFQKTKQELSKVYSFLGIDDILPSSLKPMNVGKYPPITKESAKKLEKYFEKDADKLESRWNIKL